MSTTKGFLRVSTFAGRTTRELRPDATECASCGATSRTFYDYSPDLEGDPAFCNKQCWYAYELWGHIREELQRGQRRQVVKATHTRVAPASRRKPRPRKAAAKRTTSGKRADLSLVSA